MTAVSDLVVVLDEWVQPGTACTTVRVSVRDSGLIRQIRDHRLRLWQEAKALAEAAAGENRAFTGEEQDRWAYLNRELMIADARMAVPLRRP